MFLLKKLKNEAPILKVPRFKQKDLLFCLINKKVYA